MSERKFILTRKLYKFLYIIVSGRKLILTPYFPIQLIIGIILVYIAMDIGIPGVKLVKHIKVKPLIDKNIIHLRNILKWKNKFTHITQLGYLRLPQVLDLNCSARKTALNTPSRRPAPRPHVPPRNLFKVLIRLDQVSTRR